MHDLALLLHNDSIVLAILERKFLLCVINTYVREKMTLRYIR